ncbi:short-chain dehydrogenase/reductase family protein, putative [Talaromyces stipitatus ATCC 10500]|uniref:Short-chain dehydrogenase/reductase tropG n=1 Tax=Talaromyces stipitatus (strain ATCC 10500 / CBS 375.48 / QM 6759 / NRRL 1006) TaxID=441959 RepID=TROPG_TALSN|nr:short-chain dehydrogenase/reductase family protein, putative [Talaromyces stipitatus ATCC 10500]B8M9L2.1 RecName: Full=Short-chain dehydrogenase/reductase tropG; AltName: Full=Tropolone synthesis protein G [Talaromyces stipitatus ATCC 10500]EED18014.1 short-chain dehydrogenase/reductase family protein, putative [Talaromyces stipitatus ATCC 10500]DAA64709.1 TPA_exp: TSR10 [Talaromyces stipitatus ATCC 10500]
MVKFFQPKISPLPDGIDLKGSTAVVTGASAGMGLELTRQLLQLNISTVILAVRNVAKGENVVKQLRGDPHIRTYNGNATLKVMELDMDKYDSVQRFAKHLRDEIPIVNFLILNAGIGLLKHDRSPSGHDRTLQVNYYSNALLIAELLPYLKASAERTTIPTRITWVGSRAFETTSLQKTPLQPNERVLEHMDKKEFFAPFQRYGDSKLLCLLFMCSLARQIDPKKVIINMLCPGMVNTNMSDVLPVYLRAVINVVKAIRARPVEVGVWIILNAALVAGPDSHGKFLIDKDIASESQYISSPAGQEVQKKIWEETIEELSRLTTLPPEVN